jgi:multisubunit Na+/H+ antiporter MnhF subunit
MLRTAPWKRLRALAVAFIRRVYGDALADRLVAYFVAGAVIITLGRLLGWLPSGASSL